MSIPELLDQLAKQGIQLWFEGSRLRFRGPRGALTTEQRAQLTERRVETIAALRERAAAELRIAPLSWGQRSLWFVNQDEPSSAAYNVAIALHVTSAVDQAALQDAFQALVDRHAILRTTYDIVDGRPSQRVAGGGGAAFEVRELPSLDDAALKAHIEADYQRPFDLRTGPVLRTTLYSRGAADHVLLVNAHHIALDGWSLLLLLEELRALYVESTVGTAAALPRPELEYTDYTDWQEQLLAGAEGERLGRYWQAKLAAPCAELELPSDRPRPARKSVRGATFDFQLDAALTERLRQLARDEGTTLFVLLLAAFKALLFRYSGTKDIVVGTPTLGRNKPEFGRILGDFINPVPLRSRLDAQTTFRELTANLRQTLIEALEGQEYPFALMVERLQPRRDPSRSPLFETMFVLQRFEQFRELSNLLAVGPNDTPSDFGGLKVRPYDLRQQEGQFDLGLGLVDRGDSLNGAFKYNTDLFDAATIRQLAGHYNQLLWAIIEQPQACIGALPMLSSADRAALLHAAGGHDGQPAAYAPLYRLFEVQAERQPDAIALSSDHDHLSYAELNRRANRLAHGLQELGVRPGSVVGICLPRSVDLVVTLLGVQKAGGAYVPLDPGFPAERLAYMMADSGARVLVTGQGAAAAVEVPADVRVVDIGTEADRLGRLSVANLPESVGPDDPAYLIYTSGSTGRPKGVVVSHGALVNFLWSMKREPGLAETDVLAAVTTISFDIAALELYLPLLVGARIALVARETASDGEALAAQLVSCGATVLQATPGTWRMLVEAGWRGAPGFRSLCGGEALTRELADSVLDRVGELWNLYGPTETTVWSTLERIERGPGPITIGRPIANTQIYVLDPDGQLVPIGVTGEIWIGGAGIALGYHNRPELTSERFVPDGFSAVPGARLYRTGDLGRWGADGRLHHLGRLDHQVKVRGFRIELGEIEDVLGRHAAVRECAVTVREGAAGDARLVAYVVANAPVPVVSDLREHLGKQVPDYMVPAAFVFIDKLPLTNNGKIDRHALPEPGDADIMATKDYEVPATETEKAVAQVFTEVLDIPAVSVHHNFFELGGHSLLATRALARLRQRFETEIPLSALFETPTVRGLSRWLDAAAEGGAPVDHLPRWKCLVPAQSSGSKPPLFMVTGFLDADDTMRILSNMISHLGPDQPLCGLRPRWLDGQAPQYSSVVEMTDEFLTEVRAFQPRGPYYLVGDCAAGVVAVEMARKLMEQGDDVALLVLLDTERPRFHSFFMSEVVRMLDRGRHVASVLREFVRPSEGTRRQAISHVLQRKLRRSRLGGKQTTANDHIYEQRIAYQQLLKKYRLKRYPGRIDLIVAEDMYRFIGFLGWEGFADGGLEIHRTPGSHRTFRAEYVGEFCQRLQLCLDRARSESQQRTDDVANSARRKGVLKPGAAPS